MRICDNCPPVGNAHLRSLVLGQLPVRGSSSSQGKCPFAELSQGKRPFWDHHPPRANAHSRSHVLGQVPILGSVLGQKPILGSLSLHSHLTAASEDSHDNTSCSTTWVVAGWLPTNPGNISTATPGCAGESLWCCAISQGTLPSLGPCPVDLHPGCGPRSIGLCTSSALHFTASLADCWV